MGGLSYLSLVPHRFGYILIAPSAMISAMIGVEIVYNNASFMTFANQILFYSFISLTILYSPLIIFFRKLSKARRDGIIDFGDLIRKHNYDYIKKWIDPNSNNTDPILGAADHSSLSDINGSYAPIAKMKRVPVSLMNITTSFIFSILPYIPLVFTYYSIKQLFNLFLKIMVGI
jgi:hypothetical protein